VVEIKLEVVLKYIIKTALIASSNASLKYKSDYNSAFVLNVEVEKIRSIRLKDKVIISTAK
jgi:hypothetical protein